MLLWKYRKMLHTKTYNFPEEADPKVAQGCETILIVAIDQSEQIYLKRVKLPGGGAHTNSLPRRHIVETAVI